MIPSELEVSEVITLPLTAIAVGFVSSRRADPEKAMCNPVTSLVLAKFTYII